MSAQSVECNCQCLHLIEFQKIQPEGLSTATNEICERVNGKACFCEGINLYIVNPAVYKCNVANV